MHTAAESDEQSQEQGDQEETKGTRAAPLALGETRKISDESAWIVGITDSDLDAADSVEVLDVPERELAENEQFVVATLSVTVDESAIEAQGQDINQGANPAASIFVEFVGSDGRGYGLGQGSVCYTDNAFSSTGAIYEGGVTVTGNICIGLPKDAVDGGLWRISNIENEAVWVKSK